MKMFKTLNTILSTIIGSFVGVFIGYGLYVFWDYKTHTDLYKLRPVAWYTDIVLYGIFTAVFLAVIVIIKIIVCQKKQKQKSL